MGTWADITRKPEPALEPHQQLQRTGDETVRVAVVDANALIGGVDLRSLGDKCYTIQEVLNEIRDKQSREWLAALPFNIGVREPSEESLKSIVKFSQATGDLSTLSRPDLKLLALARTLEVELNGSEHLRENPAPARAYSRRPNRRQGTMPGWGRVSKPQEWAALDEADAQMAEQAVSSCVATEPQSLEQLLQQVEESGMRDEEQGEEEEVADLEEMRNRPGLAEQLGTEGSADACSSGGAQQADGEWQTACRSRGAARRRRRTEARRAERHAAAVLEDASAEGSLPGWGGSEEEAGAPNDAAPAMEVEAAATRSDAGEEGGPPRQAEEQAAEEQGEGRRRSQVVCVTGDFAMQNVLLQMGLQLATRDGSRITELRRYVMRCHACCTVTREMERVFCGRCGNTTMERVEVLAGQGGEEHYGVNKRHVLKGTRYTLPKPRGGRFNNPVLREDVMLKKMRRKKAVEDVDPFAAEFGPDTWYRGGGAAASGRQGWTGVGPTITNYKNNPNERKMTTRSNRRKR